MSELVGACLIGQSGGPTAVINSSAYGVIKAALGKKCITKVLAAQHGIRGILDDNIIPEGFDKWGNSNRDKTARFYEYTPSNLAVFSSPSTEYKTVKEYGLWSSTPEFKGGANLGEKI